MDFKEFIESLALDYSDFSEWASESLMPKSKNQPLFQLYGKSIKAVKVEETKLVKWIESKPSFKKHQAHEKALRQTQRKSVAMLEKVLAQFRKDRNR